MLPRWRGSITAFATSCASRWARCRRSPCALRRKRSPTAKRLHADLIATIAIEAARIYRPHRRCARPGGLQAPSGRCVDPARAASTRQRQNGDQVMTLVGTNVEMVGGRAKVSGAVSYVADMEFPGQLYAKALRSPYPHAKLLRIDASKAAALPGVRAVVTRDDLARIESLFRHRRRRPAGRRHRQSALRRRHRRRGRRRQPRDRRGSGDADRSGV